MSSNLNSLTDELKKNLFFFDGVVINDLAPYVYQKMLQDYALVQVKEKIKLCLNQKDCFISDQYGLWYLDVKGIAANDNFHAILLKKQRSVSLREINKNTKSPVADGRFVQLENGHWGLTRWYIEAEQYFFKHLVIKTFKINQGVLTLQQILESVNQWRLCSMPIIEQILNKFPYFEKKDDQQYVYNQKTYLLYDSMVKRNLAILQRLKQKWQYDRKRWSIKQENLERQLNEISSAQKETAAALAERVAVMDHYHNLSTQLSEKDLLLAMRKREILRYHQQLAKSESKANGILNQCRIWVQRTQERDTEIQNLQENNNKIQLDFEIALSKLCQYKDRSTTDIAALQTENIELKQKVER
ncbi:phage-shock protein, partial [Peptococcaceae bacterium]|nr:phage-shock protein [Peptococcaceae bacterium]